MSVWEACKEEFKFEQIKASCWRMVELQASSSTRVLVATSQAHDRLEAILDEGKPVIQLLPSEKECGILHYLLLTPFRYPPLRFGSRFGTIFERGIFYASTTLTTAATEKAFYRIFLAKGTKGKVGNKNIYYTAFESKIMTSKGVDLTKRPFSHFHDQIASKTTYQETQSIGANLRGVGVQAFVAPSARAKEKMTNLNVFSPLAFDKKHNIQDTFEDWICFYTKESAELYNKKDPKNTKLVFKGEDFSVDGKFPHPPD